MSEAFEEDYKSSSTYEKENITNLDFLSRMLCRDLRTYIGSYDKYLSSKLSKELVSLFVDLSDKLGDGDVTPEVLNAILPDIGITDVRRDIIVKNYKLIYEDQSKALKKSTYERFREIVYRAYFETVNTGSAVDTLEKIQSGEFFLPPFGVMESDNFKQVNFGEFDMSTIVEELGSPLYSHFPEINELFPIKGYIPSQVTMVAGPPAAGKTLFMMTEAVEAVKQHKRVLYVAIGDLKPFDFASRICSMLMKTPMTKTALSINAIFESVTRTFPDIKQNLTVQFIRPDKYTPNQWLKLNEQLGNIKNYDVFFLDYDTNFATNKDSMYAKGDEVYTMAYTLSQYPGKYVFIGSQPKIGNWRDSALGMETASESSRKQQIIDVMITISHDRDVRNSKNHIGTINIPKNRRGGMTKFKYILDPTGLMESITDDSYVIFKDEENVISVVETPDSELDTKFVDIEKLKQNNIQHKVNEKGEVLGKLEVEQPKKTNAFEELEDL